MSNITQTKRLLPPTFLARLLSRFSPQTVDQILIGFEEEKLPVVRINTLKTTTQDIMRYFREKNIQFERIPFLNDALIIKNQKEKYFEELDVYKEGKIYFQGISSQIPALILDPKPGEKVLDLCAAPGSKTAQMAIYMQNKGEILANELDQVRHERLKYNLEKQGIKIAKTRLGNALTLVSDNEENKDNNYTEYFDKVLLDAPCSAEGRICMKDPRTYKFWSEKNIIKNAKLQRALIKSAYKALKKGGILVYSTCTLAPEENEMVVASILEKCPDLKPSSISLTLPGNLPHIRPTSNSILCLPGKVIEGFFVAKFKKE